MPDRRKVVAFAALLALALNAPSIGLDFITDDYAHRAFVQAQLVLPRAQRQLLDLFGHAVTNPLENAARVFSGVLPWWSSPDFSIAFLRPLSVASHFADYALWPSRPAPMHIENLALYAALVWVVGALYWRVLPAQVPAALAVLVYAVDEAHAEGVAWISSRNTLLCALFGAAALLLYERARREGRKRWLGASLLAFAAGLASGEGGVAAFGYLVAHAMWLDPAPARARLRWLSPFAALLLAYALLYRSLGYGTRGSSLYIDPLAWPSEYALALLQRLPAVLREQFALPTFVYRWLGEAAWPALDAVGLALLALCAWPLALLLRRDATTRFFATGLVLSALPMCAALVSPRLLFVVGIGGAGIIAQLMVLGFAAARDAAGPALRAGSRAAAVLLATLHVVLAAALALFTPVLYGHYERAVRTEARALPHGDTLHGKTLLLLNVPNFFASTLALSYRAAIGQPALTHVLCAGEGRLRLSRPGRNALVLTPVGGFMRDPWSWLVRSPDERFALGQVALLSDLTVTVEQLDEQGFPTSVRLNLPNPEDPRLVWMIYSEVDRRYVRVQLPAVGQSIALGSRPAPRRESSFRVF